jgi:RNA polymerase sigma-70 factor (ECF subfamily)
MDARPVPSDRDAFEALVVRYQVAICAIAYSVLRDVARSEEVAQDALLIAWRDRSTVTVTPGWICGIARNLARNAARRRREFLTQREPAAQQDDTRDALISREDAARANAVLEKLPDKYRDAIAIYYRGDESYSEVAAALGITEASARQRVHRGRKRLRERLSIVEAAVRTTRPGTGFTVAVIAAWALGRPASATAAAAGTGTGTGKAAWIAPALGLGALGSAIAIAVAIRSASTDDGASTAATTTSSAAIATPSSNRATHPTVPRRFPSMARVSSATPPALPAGFTPAHPASGTLTTTMRTVDLDFSEAPVNDLLQLLAHQAQIAMWSTIEEPTRVEIRVKDASALDALDQILVQAHAVRTEVEAIRIVEHGRSDAATLGGETMSLNVHALPLNQVLALVEPKLAIPIARVGRPFRVLDGQALDDESPPVTLELTNVPAGLVLQRALEQAGYGYEATTGFVITPE